MTTPQPPKPINTLEEARARIAELEKALDEAITIIVKRDALLESYERRLHQLEKSSG
ncbi:MAG: hypothetical protein K8T26_03480 [Lentisphaerae bacterium]|nr:hypothetical protein [Lentisphaerota bacterium]